MDPAPQTRHSAGKTGAAILRNPSYQFRLKRRPAPITNHADWVHGEHALQSLRVSGRELQREMTAPRVTYDQRTRPLELVEDGHHVGEGLGNRERSLRCGGFKPSVLKGGNAERRLQLGGHRVHVLIAQGRPTVKQQDWRPLPSYPTTERPPGRRR
jgi:hypothetical protein